MYLSPFNNVWGSRIIFAWPNKVFTKANWKQLRDSNHAVYTCEVGKKVESPNEVLRSREIRFDSIGRIKTPLYSSPIEDDILQ